MAVFSDLDLSRSSDEPERVKRGRELHFHGAFRSEVSLEDFLETLGCVDVDSESLRSSEDISLAI